MVELEEWPPRSLALSGVTPALLLAWPSWAEAELSTEPGGLQRQKPRLMLSMVTKKRPIARASLSGEALMTAPLRVGSARTAAVCHLLTRMRAGAEDSGYGKRTVRKTA
jgi:hypothetical protein